MYIQTLHGFKCPTENNIQKFCSSSLEQEFKLFQSKANIYFNLLMWVKIIEQCVLFN